MDETKYKVYLEERKSLIDAELDSRVLAHAKESGAITEKEGR